MTEQQNNHSIPTCGKCASWADGACHCAYSPHSNAFRESDAPACAEYISAQKLADAHGVGWHVKDWVTHHVKSAVAIAVVVIIFLGAWIITGDIFAAIILLEILLSILGEF